jgi:hypothetical protein
MFPLLSSSDQRLAAVMLQDLISTFGVCRITSLDQVRWHLRPSGKKCTSKKKKKKTYYCYPCFCDPQSPLLPCKPSHVIVQYFGSTRYAQNVAHVVPSQLVPFFTSSTTANEGADKASSPFGSDSASLSTAAATSFADHVEMYLATLAVQERYKFHPDATKTTETCDMNGPDHGRVERLFLQGVVDHFIVHPDHDRPAAAVATAQLGITKRCTDDDDDDDADNQDDEEDQDDEEEPDKDDDDDDDDGNEEERRNEQAKKLKVTSSPEKAAAVDANSSPRRYTQRLRQPKHQPPVKVRQVMKLRAGDYIRYWYVGDGRMVYYFVAVACPLIPILIKLP